MQYSVKIAWIWIIFSHIRGNYIRIAIRAKPNGLWRLHSTLMLYSTHIFIFFCLFGLAVIISYLMCTATGVVLLINSCEYCTKEAEEISGHLLKINLPHAAHGSAVNAAKHEFLQQIFNQRIELSAKGFFAVNRRFLATVSAECDDCQRQPIRNRLTIGIFLCSWRPRASPTWLSCYNFRLQLTKQRGQSRWSSHQL